MLLILPRANRRIRSIQIRLRGTSAHASCRSTGQARRPASAVPRDTCSGTVVTALFRMATIARPSSWPVTIAIGTHLMPTDTTTEILDCGCVWEVDVPELATRCVSQCDAHPKDRGRIGLLPKPLPADFTFLGWIQRNVRR